MLSLNALRNQLSVGERLGFLEVELYPPGSTTAVKLWMRCSDLYIVGFRGATKWYFLEENISSPPNAGVKRNAPVTLNIGTNYNNLVKVGEISAGDLACMGNLADYEGKGDEVDLKAFVLAAAVVSEALRFATVATYFTGLINGVIPKVDISQLNKRYFTNWAEMTGAQYADVLLPKQ